MYDDIGGENVEYLKACIKSGLWVWYNNGDHWVLVARIVDEVPAENETGPCAYLDGGKGQYAALDACDLEHFMVTTAPITKWPVKP